MARILFVDDDVDTLETLTRAVQLFGHESILAGSGAEALVIVAQQAPELIFIDMSLPDIDGLKLLANLKAQPVTRDIPVLILSASPELDIAEAARAAGAQDYILKPIRLQTLLDVIKHYTAR